ncbi:MAG: S-layer homology domain-containing protein [Clostridiales bacterium]|nr:S-layer homology domain-containing protein [Clostridiales bacterium]
MKKRKTKILSIALITVFMLTLTLSPFTSQAASADFADTKGHWAKSYIDILVKSGAVVGMPDGNFHPSDIVTMPQFVTMIMRGKYGTIEPTGKGYASGYLDAAFELGIIIKEDVEEPGLVRFDAVRIVNNCLTMIYGEDPVSGAQELGETFLDYPENCSPCQSPFNNEIAQCYAKGIITGRPGPVFDGDASLTRAEACVILTKMLDKDLRTPPEAAPEPPKGFTEVTPEEFVEMQKADSSIVLLDVRDQQEHNEGFIPGSICIPLNTLIVEEASQLPDKEAVIVVYCKIGARSTAACEFLAELGYQNVYHLGGIDDWPYEIIKQEQKL